MYVCMYVCMYVGGLGYFFSLKIKWGYVSARLLQSKRSKIFFLRPFH